MFKEFLMRKMLKSQLKGVPEEEQERLLKVVTENPELFQKIAVEVKEQMSGGKDQMAAVMAVMGKHQDELKKILGK